MRMKYRITFLQKIFLLLLVSMSIPVLILFFVVYNKTTSQMEQLTSAFLMENLDHNHTRLNDFFQKIEKYSQTLIASERFQVLREENERELGDDASFTQKTIPIIREYRGNYDLTIYPPDLQRLPSYLRFIPTKDHPEKNWFQRTLESEGRGLWYFDPQSGFQYLRLIRDMVDLQPLAVIKINVPTQEVIAQLTPLKQFSHMDYYLTEDGNPLVRVQRLELDSKPIPESFFIAQVYSQQPAVLYKYNSHYVVSILLDANSWRLTVTVPERDLVGSIQDLRQFSLLILLLIICIISVLLILFTAYFISPIAKLIQLMNKVQQGQLVESRQDASRRDEIGLLIRGYNRLIHGIHELLETTRKVEEEKGNLRLQMLIHQINPHFLFNTLDGIKWRIEQLGEQKVAAMITSLCNLLRYSMNNEEEYSTVEREMEHAKAYLNIELLRSNHGFKVFFRIHPECLNYPMLKLVIQPIVENAVRHGVNKLNHDKGRILIHVFLKEARLAIVIEDNGPGFPADMRAAREQPVVEAGSGIGLRNVHQRLFYQFGDPYGINIDRSWETGAKVTIIHPIIKERKR
jgi:two-component system sensor histidine kinase YesM